MPSRPRSDNSVCVAYADIVGWSKQSLTRQVETAVELFQRVLHLVDIYKLRPLWKIATGDGFALGFPPRRQGLVLQMFADLLDTYLSDTGPELRISLAEGAARSYDNPLTQSQDLTGPAVIEARRILDGITGGGVLLIEEHLARQIMSDLSPSLRPFIVDHPVIIDKHGQSHTVRQMLPRVPFGSRGLQDQLSDFEDLAKSTIRTEIGLSASRLSATITGLDGTIVLWMWLPRGIPSTAVKVEPDWNPSSEQDALDGLEEIDGKFDEEASPYVSEISKLIGDDNRPKVWLRGFRSYLTDRASLLLRVGKTDYQQSRSIQRAFDKGGLLSKFENGTFDVLSETPSGIATASAILTSDHRLIVSQRKDKEVDFAAGSYSVSFEEQWDPRIENNPHDSVLRGLHEEFHADKNHGIYVTQDNLRVLALGREWGAYWNTSLFYIVNLPAQARTFLSAWESLPPPKDKNEHRAVAAVPLDKSGVRFLQDLLPRGSKLLADQLRKICGSQYIAGSPRDGDIHDTTGRARILLALAFKHKIGMRT